MYQRKVKNRFGSGVLRKCRGCQQVFGLYTNRPGIGGMFLMDEFELGFSIHEVNCLTSGIWNHIKFDKKVGTYEA